MPLRQILPYSTPFTHHVAENADIVANASITDVMNFFILLKASLIGAEGETRTHGGFPTPYKSVAIAAMRLQLISFEHVFIVKISLIRET